jgi:hypothetical protein
MSNENSDTSKQKPDFKEFIIGLLFNILFSILLSIVFLGTVGLYTCKVAQANVLPDNVEYAPFGNYMRDVASTEVNINIIKEYGLFGFGWLFFQKPKTVLSEKAIFDNEEIIKSYYSKWSILGNLKSNSHNGNWYLYFSNVINSIIAKNNTGINTVYQYINENCSEWLIILLYSALAPFIYIGMFFCNFWLSVWYHLAHINDLFKNIDTNTNEWEPDPNVNYFRPMKILWTFLLVLFCGVPFTIIWLFTSIYSIIEPLCIPYKVKGSNKTHGFFSFFLDSLVYKKQLVMLLFSYFLLKQTSSSLGSTYLVSAFIAILIGIFLGYYKETIPTKSTFTSDIASYKPAKASKGKEVTVAMEKEMSKEDTPNQNGGNKKQKNKKPKNKKET